MTDSTTPAPVRPRLAAPVGTRLRGPCLSALFKTAGFAGGALGVHRLSSTIHDQPGTAAAEPII
jgi:hypothetical protein